MFWVVGRFFVFFFSFLDSLTVLSLSSGRPQTPGDPPFMSSCVGGSLGIEIHGVLEVPPFTLFLFLISETGCSYVDQTGFELTM